jgi:hypothetical protein
LRKREVSADRDLRQGRRTLDVEGGPQIAERSLRRVQAASRRLVGMMAFGNGALLLLGSLGAIFDCEKRSIYF